MDTKFYKIIHKITYMEGGTDSVDVKVFLDKELAIKFLKREITYAKQDVEGEELENYCVEEDDTSYKRYSEEYASQDTVSIWLEEDTFYDEMELEKEKDDDLEK